jgi:hypothetical protein
MIEFIRKWLPVDEQAADRIAEDLVCVVQPRDPSIALDALKMQIKASLLEASSCNLLGFTPDEQALLHPDKPKKFQLSWCDKRIVNVGATIDIAPDSVQCPYGNSPLKVEVFDLFPSTLIHG